MRRYFYGYCIGFISFPIVIFMCYTILVVLLNIGSLQVLDGGHNDNDVIGYINGNPYIKTTDGYSGYITFPNDDGDIISFGQYELYGQSNSVIYNESIYQINYEKSVSDETFNYEILNYGPKGAALGREKILMDFVPHLLNFDDLSMTVVGSELFHIIQEEHQTRLLIIDLDNLTVVKNEVIFDENLELSLLVDYSKVEDDNIHLVGFDKSLKYYNISIDNANIITTNEIYMLEGKLFERNDLYNSYKGVIGDKVYGVADHDNNLESLDIETGLMDTFNLDSYNYSMIDSDDNIIVSKIIETGFLGGGKTSIKTLDENFEELDEVVIDEACTSVYKIADDRFVCRILQDGVLSNMFGSDEYNFYETKI